MSIYTETKSLKMCAPDSL